MSIYMGDQPVQGVIKLAVTPGSLSIAPGQPANLQVVLTNSGTTVDEVTFMVEGAPAEWVQGAGQRVLLPPGRQEAITLLIDVGRKPGNRARDYAITLRACSRTHPQAYSQVRLNWAVQPFQEALLQLEPHRAAGHGKASYTIGLQNWSNLPQRYALSLGKNDEEQHLAHQFRSNPVDLEAGEQTQVSLQVQGKRRLLGQQQRILFQLHAGLEGGSPTQHSSAEFVNKPLLPTWAVSLIAAMLVLSGLGLSSLLSLRSPRTASGGTMPTATVLSQAVMPTSGVTATIAASPTSTVTASPGPGQTPSAQPSGQPTAPPAAPGPPLVSQETSVVSSLKAPIGSQYIASKDSIYFVEEAQGNLWVLSQVNSSKPQSQFLGAGYNGPEDIYVTANGSTAYIDDIDGELLAVNLNGSNRDFSAATVITSGLISPIQMTVDEAHHLAYVVENSAGDVAKVDLTTGAITRILAGLSDPLGILLSADGNSVYITEVANNTGYLSRYSLLTSGGSRVMLASAAVTTLFYLSWVNSSKNALLITENGNVSYFSLARPGLQSLADLATTPNTATVASASGSLPIVICTNTDIEKLT